MGVAAGAARFFGGILVCEVGWRVVGRLIRIEVKAIERFAPRLTTA